MSYNLGEMVKSEIENGYEDTNAQAKVCQDIILKAISNSSMREHVTVKGGVVMRSKTRNIRRATQDLDIDFIKYSLADEAIDIFIKKLNCFEGISISRIGVIEELKQQDYHGKRVYLKITDNFGNIISSKLDLGVHNRLDIKQEEYCFDVAFDEEGASLLINSSEQMFVEKLRSLLRFGALSTRYKDVFDMYFLCKYIDKKKLEEYMNVYIFNDDKMREKDIDQVVKRVKIAFSDRTYRRRLQTTDKKWLDGDAQEITDGIIEFLLEMKKELGE